MRAKLESLKLETTGRMPKNWKSYTVELRSDGTYSVSDRSFSKNFEPPCNDATGSGRCTPAEFAEILNHFDFHRWKREYAPPKGIIVFDGESGTLKYKYVGEPEEEITFQNSFPDSWKKLLRVLSKA